MATVEADDGVPLWVERTGSGAPGGVPLVLCHGGPGLWDNLGPLAALLDHHREVVRWDQRGCGRSGGADGPFSLAQSLADLDAIRRHCGFDRWIVGGHSWGASLALRAVLAQPATAAGLLYLSGTGLGRRWHPAYKAAPGQRLTPEQLARADVLEGLPDRTRAEEVEWRTLRWAPDYADRGLALDLAAIDASAPYPVNLACNAALNAETKTWDEGALLAACAALDVASLFVHGADDPRPPFAIDDVVRAIPGADVRILAGVGHTPWLERPGEVASVLRDWLAQRS